MIFLLAAVVSHKLISPQRKAETRLSSLQESSHNLRRRIPMLSDGSGALTRLLSKIRPEEITNPKLLGKRQQLKSALLDYYQAS